MPRVCACAWRRVTERLVVALLLAAGAAHAETAIKGTVTDRVTGAPLAGVEIEVRRGGQVLGQAISNAGDGSFLVTVEVGNQPQAVNLKLLARRDGYQGVDEDVVVVSARPRPAAAGLELLRSELADCLSKTRPRWVVVGHFRPPLGQQDTGAFSVGVFEAVRWELSKIADTSSIAPDRRPVVVDCRAIDELDFLSAAARELKADVLLAGRVSPLPDRPRFKVSMFVGDQHGLSAAGGAPVTSRDVDLDDPSASRLDAEASGAIVRALLAGYLKAGRFEECVELARRAGSEIRPPSDEIRSLSDQCGRQLAANGLRGGSR